MKQHMTSVRLQLEDGINIMPALSPVTRGGTPSHSGHSPDIFSVSVFFEFLTGVLRGGLVEVVVKLLFEYCGAGGYKNYAGLF